MLGLSQAELAAAGANDPPLTQARISEIERGHMPRKKKWPPLLRAYRLEGKESEFYRMILSARKLRNQKAALQKPLSETEPLLASAIAEHPGEILSAQADQAAQKAGGA